MHDGRLVGAQPQAECQHHLDVRLQPHYEVKQRFRDGDCAARYIPFLAWVVEV